MARKSRKSHDIATTITFDSNIQKQQIFRVGAYVRLSAEDKKQKGDSIETQQAIIAAYISDHHDFELVEVYIDNGLSGQSFERPAFNRMITDMENGIINACVTKDLSRLGCNTIDTGYYVEKYFPTKGIRFIAITDDYDSANPNSGGIMLSLKNMVNEAFALEIGRKVRQSKQMNIQKGLFVGRFAPYGYLKCQKSKHQFVPDPYAAPIVQKMFDMVSNGKKVSEVADWLNTSGILPPKKYFHSIGLATEKEAAGNNHWNRGVIYGILQNQVYCGDMVQGKFATKSYVQKKQPKSNWIIVENTHKPIINRELFEAVQNLWIESKKAYASRKPYSENIFLSKVFCGHCGFSMKRNKSGKSGYLLQCNTKRVYTESSCVLVSINENDLKEKLLDALNKQAEVLGDIFAFSLQADNSQQPDQAITEKTELQKLQSSIKQTSHFLKSLYESLSQECITLDEYKEMKTGYEIKIAELTAKEKDLRNSLLNKTAINAVKSKTATHLKDVSQISDLSAETLERLIEKIIISSDKQIEVQFKFADELAQRQCQIKGEAVVI